jgi:hypothetical protein
LSEGKYQEIFFPRSPASKAKGFKWTGGGLGVGFCFGEGKEYEIYLEFKQRNMRNIRKNRYFS